MLDTNTSWGKRNDQIDVRSLRRFKVILKTAETIGEWLVFFVLFCSVCSIGWLFAKQSFENVIFFDGTEATCVLNGATGEIKNAN